MRLPETHSLSSAWLPERVDNRAVNVAATGLPGGTGMLLGEPRTRLT
jgi:hypothetical protein